ncbi:DUF6545 domain-containing protein [Oerskovia turbata]
MTYLAVVLFAGAAAWTAVRHRSHLDGDRALSWGLALVAAASALRIDVVLDAVRDVAPAAVDELAKHVLLGAGCLCIGAWVLGAQGRRPQPLRLVVCIVGVVGLLVLVFALNGPWERQEIGFQTRGRPWMALYWVAFYATFLWATAMFGVSTVRQRRSRPLAARWGMDLAAVGAFLGVLWALSSMVGVVDLVLDAPSSAEAHILLGIPPHHLVAASSVLITVGIMGQLLAAARIRRRRHTDLCELHAHLVDAVAEHRLPAVRPEVAEYHRTIEIMDALATLSRYADPHDAVRVRAVVGDVPESVLRALQIDLATTRRGMDERPASPADWSAWADDDRSLRDLGRAFRGLTSERRAHVLVKALGYDDGLEQDAPADTRGDRG